MEDNNIKIDNKKSSTILSNCTFYSPITTYIAELTKYVNTIINLIN